MAFVAGRSLVLGAGVVVPIPMGVDVAGISPSFTMYSHMRLPGGTTYTFDNGVVHVVPATTDTVVAIPVSATSIVATAASTAQLGQSL
jgi:hypothetical protein